MATRAIRPKRDDGPLGSNWQSMPERAPSVVRSDRPIVARFAAFAALTMVAVGGLAMILAANQKNYLIGPEWGFVWFSLGLGGLLYHAFRDTELQYRRAYGLLGFVLLVVGIVLRVFPVKSVMGAWFLPYGIPCLAMGLLFLVAVVRNESEARWRTFTLRVAGFVGGFMILAGLIGGHFSQNFLQGEGSLLLLLGLFFLSAHIGLQPSTSQEGYWAGMLLGMAALVSLGAALIRSYFGDNFLVPNGFILVGFSLAYLMVSASTCSDRTLLVLTRRELSSLFYSPIAYFVFFGVLIVGWISFSLFVTNLIRAGGMFEPFLVSYFINFFTVVCVIIVVPLLTMRLLSEEKRSGTLEVLLTAPVNESSIVLSKFLAVLLFYLLSLSPWGLFLLALRVFGEQPFEYRPLLSFLITVIFTGAGFLSAGLFFSSLTRNQIVAAVFTLAFMMGFTFTSRFFIRAGEPWGEIIGYISYLDLWVNSLEGLFSWRYLFFHFSLAVFFLFLTTKVLESRKWTS